MSTLARCRLVALACGAAWLLAGPGASTAAEKKVYRCGQTYQQVPCGADAGASGQAIDASDPRSAEQRSDARAAAAADKRQAKALVAERLQREKASQSQQSPMGTSLKPGEPPASAPEADEPKTHAKKHKKKKAPEPDRYVPPPKPPTGKG